MTPQERRLVDELFDKLATLERAPREPDAEEAIHSGLQRAPNAIYPLVQTVLLQEEALRRAQERIRELESDTAPDAEEGGGFLDSMRETIFGGGNPRPRGAVPPVNRNGRPMGVPDAFRNAGPSQGAMGQPPMPAASQPGAAQGGGSFLGTAAATAVGVIGGSLLFNSVKDLMGGGKETGTAQAAAGDTSGSQAGPWGDASSGDLAKQAGLDNVGKPDAGKADTAQAQDQQGYDPHAHDDFEAPYDTADAGGDDYDFDFGDSDFG